MIKAVIFDMDGLLFDSEPIACLSTFAMLEEYGVNYKGDANFLLGLRNVDIMSFFKKQLGIKDSVENMLKKKQRIFFRMAINIKLMPGFSKIKRLVDKQGWKKALATSATRSHADFLLKKHNLFKYFDTKVTAEQVKKGKPHPETFLTAANKLRVKPEKCLVLEDSPNGLLSAKQAGMKCIVVPNEMVKRKEFKKADAIVKSLAKVNFSLIKKIYNE